MAPLVWGLTFFFFISSQAIASEVTDPFPGSARSYAVFVNETLLWAHKPDMAVPMASLAKIMTSLIILEKHALNEIVTVTAEAAKESGTSLSLKKGEKFYIIDLLAAALIRSANDSCRALADYSAGNEKSFVINMNKFAKKLGLKNTNFVNACGHDAKSQYSTARDLATLTLYALKNPTFTKLVSLVKGKIGTVGDERTFTIENTNALIGRYPGAIGVKTGFTQGAGKCIIALAQRNETRVLVVLLNSRDRWWKAVAMLDKAFEVANNQNKSE